MFESNAVGTDTDKILVNIKTRPLARRCILTRVRGFCVDRNCIAIRPTKSAVCPRVRIKPLNGKPLGACLRLPGADTASTCLLGSNQTCFLSALTLQTWKPVPCGPSQAAKARVTRAAEAALPVQAKRFLATPSFDALALAFAQHAAARFEAAALAEVCCPTSPPASLHHSSTPAMSAGSHQSTARPLYFACILEAHKRNKHGLREPVGEAALVGTPCKRGLPDPSLAAAQALERAERLRLEGLQPGAVRERVRALRSAAAAHQADMSLPYAQALSS